MSTSRRELLRTSCVTAALLVLAVPGRAQVTQAWVARNAGPGIADDRAKAVAVDDDGNVYVTGQRGGPNGLDLATIKYDPSGAEVWARLYDGPAHGNDAGAAVAVDDDGNVYVTGYSFGLGTGTEEQDYVTIKYDASGTQLWAARYNGPVGDWDEAFALAVDAAGNVHVTGRSNNSGIWFDFDFLTIKYDPAGNALWVARYNGPADDWDEAVDLALDGDGNVYVTGGATRQPGTAYRDYATVKYDASGTLQWARLLDGEGRNSDTATAIAVDDLGHVVVTGYSSGSAGTVYNYVTVQYDTAGALQWARSYDSAFSFSADVAYALGVDEAGNVYVTGSSVLDYATVKYDVAGNEQWVRRFGTTSADDIPAALAVGASGAVYVTGESADDYVTVSYDAAGATRWEARYDGPASGNAQDAAAALAVDAAERVYVTGASVGAGSGADMATVKYTQATVAVSATGTPGTVAPGGTVTVTAVVSNNTGAALTVDGWIVAARNGTPLLTRLVGSGTLPAGATVTRSLPLRVPASTPPGLYAVTFNVGDFGTLAVLGSDTFPITVTAPPSREGAASSAEPFEIEAIPGDLFAASGLSDAGLAAYPNPARGQATIRFTLPEAANARLAVYDVLGREVAVLVDGRLEAGAHAATFDARGLPAGPYVYRFAAGERAQTGRITLVR
jgi:hypothetical protein